MFRRDAYVKPAPGLVIAEFTCGQDALEFCRMKGKNYTVTAGINHVYAVRVTESAAESGSTERSSAAPVLPQEPAGGVMQLTAHTEPGRELLRRLPHGDSL